ncbi:MAG: SDR family NAD(P)-dependent oxidoreductase [Hyphomonadaceae bacterium]|nr:SDR family NAD(P)-dependent oxidoreductase [Hyphomonadaceae bacterium]
MGATAKTFSGGVAVITGAGAGIGAGLARQAARLGMKVAALDISADRLSTLSTELRALGAEVLPIVTDVGVAANLDAAAEQVHATWGDVRLLINNAGIETIGNSWEIPAARWEQTLNVNLHGVIHGVRAFAPRMLASGKPGFIANLASIGAFGAMPMQTAYILTKHAVQSFSECLYLEIELTGKPVRVSTIVPGLVRSEIFADTSGESAHARAHRKAMREMMAAYGMDLDEACTIILDQVAAGEFWVSTQPDMTRDMIAGRTAFLSTQSRPALTPQTKALLASSDP